MNEWVRRGHPQIVEYYDRRRRNSVLLAGRVDRTYRRDRQRIELSCHSRALPMLHPIPLLAYVPLGPTRLPPG
jgi:hypothetical protein